MACNNSTDKATAAGNASIAAAPAGGQEAVQAHVVPPVSVLYGASAHALDREAGFARNPAGGRVGGGMLNRDTVKPGVAKCPVGHGRHSTDAQPTAPAAGTIQ